jgi:hypothetical protein
VQRNGLDPAHYGAYDARTAKRCNMQFLHVRFSFSHLQKAMLHCT